MSTDTSIEPGHKSRNDSEPQDESANAQGVEVIEILPGFTNFDDFVNVGFEALKTGIKAANGLPSGEKYDYYKCFPTFRNIINEEINNVLVCMQNITEGVGVRGNIRRRDIEEKFELLIEANDILLERAGICMDEASGILRNPDVEFVVSQSNSTAVSGSWNNLSFHSKTQQTQPANKAQAICLLTAKNIQRPQLKFDDKIDNSIKPWQPRIKDKPNSLKPLALYVEEDEDGEFFSHPYEFELDRFEAPEHQLESRVPVEYKHIDDTSLIVIEKPEDIKILLDDLSKYTEIAVDLEHHSYRSFQGITCLMQISTKDTDYLVDTLSLRSELHQLNEIFTKPSILKVFHGAGSDIEWLQRDLSLYIVNMFDTHIAAKQLNFPYLSLAHLMKRYCDIDPNKHFQLADWRVRPLPEELMKYAREDTHYLLYIKDNLMNALLEQANGQSNILKAVYDRSTDVCKKIYRKPVWSEEKCMNLYRKSKKMFNNRQLYALRELHKWRDATGRAEDDSTGYVLPNHMLLNIAESLPREMQGILACCNPIPPLVRQNALSLHKIILKAKEQPMVKPILEDDIRQRMTQRNQVTDLETTLLYSPHDMPHDMEIRADLPCLLDLNSSSEINVTEQTIPHTVTVFDSPPQSEDENTTGHITRKKRRTPFISPFERYKRVVPMVAAEEAKERERQEKEEAERIKLVENSGNEIAESKNRVYKHFKDVVGAVTNPVSVQQSAGSSSNQSIDSKQFGPDHKTLSQMQGRKRKRQSNYHDDTKLTESQDDLSTPLPFLHKKFTQNYRRDKRELNSPTQGVKKQKKSYHDTGHSSFTEDTELSANNALSVKSLRNNKKKSKQENKRNMKEKGILPRESFDYKNVDFSSFQGGSRAHNQIPFQAQNKKKNARGNRGKGNRGNKKQKWNC
ncbi:exosome component 10 [Neodiprion virginianus]|uniref:exosome component 10 n=1 Tax=Neodiprion virginianus TaxID=2961670 RepID=UPI001EE703AA|nr:exosome component 10 [Neodiprion virginianus]